MNLGNAEHLTKPQGQIPVHLINQRLQEIRSRAVISTTDKNRQEEVAYKFVEVDSLCFIRAMHVP